MFSGFHYGFLKPELRKVGLNYWLGDHCDVYFLLERSSILLNDSKATALALVPLFDKPNSSHNLAYIFGGKPPLKFQVVPSSSICRIPEIFLYL